MRFIDYMNLSSNTDESMFRSLKIDIVDNDRYTDLVCRLAERHKYITESIRIVNSINQHFKRYYSGSKYKYGFCIEGNINIDRIKLHKKQKELLYKEYYKVNDRFESLKKQFENDILYDKYLT